MTSDRELGNSGKNVEPWVPEGSVFWVQLCFWLTDLGRLASLDLLFVLSCEPWGLSGKISEALVWSRLGSKFWTGLRDVRN